MSKKRNKIWTGAFARGFHAMVPRFRRIRITLVLVTTPKNQLGCLVEFIADQERRTIGGVCHSLEELANRWSKRQPIAGEWKGTQAHFDRMVGRFADTSQMGLPGGLEPFQERLQC